MACCVTAVTRSSDDSISDLLDAVSRSLLSKLMFVLTRPSRNPLTDIHCCLQIYVSVLKVGDKITLADITVASALVYPMKLVLSPEYRKAFPCVTRWFTTCVNQPQFKAVIGTVELAKEEMTADGAPAAPKKEKVSLLPFASKRGVCLVLSSIGPPTGW